MNGPRRYAPMGLWTLPGLPDLWTRKRTRAHKVLGRRQTAAGAHSPLETGKRPPVSTAPTRPLSLGGSLNAPMDHGTGLLERFVTMT
jgi:hypothetical protein